MTMKAALLAPLAWSLSLAAQAEPVSDMAAPDMSSNNRSLMAEAAQAPVLRVRSGIARRWLSPDAVYQTPVARQVRIEQRVIVRISPRGPSPRQSLMAELPDHPFAPQLVERRMDDCIDLEKIAGVQTTRNNRLLLFLRDQRLVSASLEKSCRARDFYSGFYVEPSKDGQICVKRDKLLSRSGANCEIDRMRQLVADGGD